MAGLLDALFDPSLYSGGAGLLSRLQPMTGQIAPSQGFEPERPAAIPGQALPISVGQYQMPRMSNADLYSPQQVNLPPNAQPAQGQLPQPQQPPGFFDRLNNGFQSIGNGGSVIGALTGNYTDVPNQTQKFLTARGFDPGLAKAVTSDPGLLRAVLPQVLGISGQTDDIKEYQFAKQQEPGLTFKDWMQRKKAVSGEYSLNPVYGTDAKGNTVLLQTGKSGEAIQTKLPDGVKVSSGVDKVDLGTQWGIIDKRTGNLVGTQPKDVAGKEAAEKRGQAQGTAQAALANGADIDAEQTKNKIDALLKNEGLDAIVGPVDQFRPSWTLGKSGRDALARLEQLQGGAFLQAYSTLKGGGAITEMEGQKAEKAIARMQRSQSEDDFRQALKDFRDAIDIGLQKLRRAASGGAEPPAPASTPSASANLKQKYGLD